MCVGACTCPLVVERRHSNTICYRNVTTCVNAHATSLEMCQDALILPIQALTEQALQQILFDCSLNACEDSRRVSMYASN